MIGDVLKLIFISTYIPNFFWVFFDLVNFPEKFKFLSDVFEAFIKPWWITPVEFFQSTEGILAMVITLGFFLVLIRYDLIFKSKKKKKEEEKEGDFYFLD